jgi:hypothetical protein
MGSNYGEETEASIKSRLDPSLLRMTRERFNTTIATVTEKETPPPSDTLSILSPRSGSKSIGQLGRTKGSTPGPYILG